MTARTSAALRLRGRDGPLRAELTWPPGDPDAVLVFIDDGEGAPACRILGDELRAMTLCAQCATHHDARVAVEWTADHAKDLGAASRRMTLAGHGAAAGLALAASDAWPALERLVLIRPQLGELPPTRVPTVVVTAGDDAGLAAAVR
jgi:hypothetical protein